MGTAAHILNRAPRKGLGWRTPYELMFGHAPSIAHIRVYSCRAWVYNEHGDKWDPKAKPMILIGYEFGSKSYRLWDPASRSVKISANVKFSEKEFPSRPADKPKKPKASSSSSPPELPPTNQSYMPVPWDIFSEDDTGGEGAWKPVITCWVHLELMCIFPTM